VAPLACEAERVVVRIVVRKERAHILDEPKSAQHNDPELPGKAVMEWRWTQKFHAFEIFGRERLKVARQRVLHFHFGGVQRWGGDGHIGVNANHIDTRVAFEYQHSQHDGLFHILHYRSTAIGDELLRHNLILFPLHHHHRQDDFLHRNAAVLEGVAVVVEEFVVVGGIDEIIIFLGDDVIGGGSARGEFVLFGPLDHHCLLLFGFYVASIFVAEARRGLAVSDDFRTTQRAYRTVVGRYDNFQVGHGRERFKHVEQARM
jgi:hypothetical protein